MAPTASKAITRGRWTRIHEALNSRNAEWSHERTVFRTGGPDASLISSGSLRGLLWVSSLANLAKRLSASGTPAGYRADLDGLRALAITAVILSHAGIGIFEGGYIGVDMFFVLSGYLIHQDLVSPGHERHVSLVGFFARRARRILPALYVVSAVSLVGALWVLMPGDLDRMARSLIAVVLLVPNIFFMSEIGYFDSDAVTKPLLHAWSLGVEAQFYLAAPFLPWLLSSLSPPRRRSAMIFAWLAALAGTSALYLYSPIDAFYLMPSRLFEFLIGAMLVEGIVPPVHDARIAEALTGAALAILAVSIVLFYFWVPHPGILTLLPCAATAAIIHAGATRETRVSKLLSAPPVAFIGLISYSLYLWHWPILAFTRYAGVNLTPIVLVGDVALLAGLSFLSWRFIEIPFRHAGSPWRAKAPRILSGAGVIMVGSCACIIVLRGLPERFPPDVAAVAAYYTYRDQKPFREGQCLITSNERLRDFDRGTCLKIVTSEPNVLLIGDSHAAHLWTGLRDIWPNVNFLQATASGCKPFVDTQGASNCRALMSDMLERFVPNHHLDAIVIAALWTKADEAPLRATIAALKPYTDKVVVFGPLPVYRSPAATLIANAMLCGNLDTVPSHLDPSTKPLNASFRAAVAPLATYVSAYDLLCPAEHCRLFAAPNVPMQFDYHHLTPAGSDVLLAAVRAKDAGLFEPQRSTSNR